MRYPSVGLIDLGIGNLHSVKQSCRSLSARVHITRETHQLDRCDLLILPGVGSFPHAFSLLREYKLDSFLLSAHSEQRHILGICLGMQLLCEYSHEGVLTPGLGIFSGVVNPFPKYSTHIGWNSLTFSQNPLCKPLPIDLSSDFFFNHTFHLSTLSPHSAYYSVFGTPFAAIVQSGNTFGVQFHPEKSQAHGRSLLKYFLDRSVA